MKRILCIGILYILANILILGNNFLYWDDWVWFHLDSTERFNAYLEMGSPISAALCDFFYALPNPTLAFRLLTFCSGFITALCYSSTLKKLHIISKEEYFVALALCALLPVSVGVKYLNCVAVYSFYIALFSIATRLVITESKKKTKHSPTRQYSAFFHFFYIKLITSSVWSCSSNTARQDLG